MSSKKRRNKKRSHINKYADKSNIDFKQKKQKLSESDMITDEYNGNEVQVSVPKKTTQKKEQVKEQVKVQVQVEEVSAVETIKETEVQEQTTNHRRRNDGYYKNINQVISEKRERNKEMGVSQRVKRGMVFWYDVDPSKRKDDEHMVKVNGIDYHDYVMYGNRPWVVVSCEDNNVKNQMVTVVPMSSGKAFTSRYNHSHVDIFFGGVDTCVMCEQIRTVNAVELRDYMSTLDDSVMDKIEDAIMYQTGIVNKVKFSDETTKSALDKIEFIIESIIKTKIEETVPTRATQTDIDDAVTRISDSLESMFSDRIKGVRDVSRNNVPVEKSASVTVKSDRESNVDKFYKRFPEEKKKIVTESANTTQVKVRPTISTDSSGTRRWDKKTAMEFIKDFDNMDADDVMEKWGYQTRKTCQNMKYYLEKKYSI